MTKRAIVLLAGCLFIAGGLFWGTEPAAAQGKAPVEVVHAMTHDVSPPLDKMPVIPPGAGPTVPILLRKVRPFQTSRATQQDTALQSSASTSLSVNTGQNFLGVGNGLSGFRVQYIPPDTNGAAGDTQFVQWVNASFAVFNKSSGNVVYGPAAGNTLWSGMSGTAGRACSRNNSGDPIAQYDKQAGQWVMMQPVFKSPYYLCVAVSTTSDATGSWYRYAIPIPTGLFPDYPKLAVWSDAYYVTYNQFQGNSFVGAAACALDRSNMLLGNNATMQCFSVNPSFGSLLPADLDGSTQPPSGSPDYLLDYGSDLASLDVWQFHVDFGTPSNSTLTHAKNLPVAAFTEACGGGTCIPQKGTTQQLDSLGDRLMYRVAYRNFGSGSYESMLVSQSVDTGSASGNTGIRWYELRETSPSTSSQSNWGWYQQGTYAPDSSYRWMPSIAQDKNGDIAMGYSVSSSTESPTIRYTGRVPGDTLGQMEGENDILTGINTGSQTSYTRWGDYSSMALDPMDDCTFWYTNEYQPTTGSAWSTRIASFVFPGCGSSTTSVSVSSVTLSSYTVTGGSPVSGTVTLSEKAPSGGANVTFTSSNHTAAPDPTSITISQNQISGTFTVNTNQVSAQSQVTITANYNGSSQTTSTLTVTPASSGAVTLTPTSNTINVAVGSSGSDTINVVSKGYAGSVTLSVSGLPKFANGSFSPNSVTVSSSGSASSTLTIKTNKRVSPVTSQPLTITASDSSGNIIGSTSVTLNIQ